MADTIFGKIQEEKDLYKLSNGENPSYIWFNEKVKELISISESPSELLTKWERRANKVQLYRFNMFFYDAKTKKTLPYFDMFPLVFPLRRLGNSFTGINAHYLPPSFKEDFFNIYNKFALNDEFDETTLYRMTWSKRFNRNVIQNVRILRQVYINSRKHIRFGKNFKGIR